MLIHPDKDPMGTAMCDYLKAEQHRFIKVKSSITEDDTIPVQYLFRHFHEMPELEQKALHLANGRILDVGSGAGSHSLYLQKKGLDVVALDNSPNACLCCQQRGITKVVHADFFKYLPEKKFDTLLLMMNGIGIAGSLSNLTNFFGKIKEVLAPGGQVLLDSSDIRYMFEDEDIPIFPPHEGPYYGEVTYQMSYKKVLSDPFSWLFIDSLLLKTTAELHGFTFEKLADGSHYDYLARLSIKP